MNIFPAIDIIEKNAVRLLRGDYNKKTVYSASPAGVALSFAEQGAEFIHIVDLDGAKSGKTENLDVISEIINVSGLKAEVGGGIRSEETIKQYIDIGVFRVILGTAALTKPDFMKDMIRKYGDKIAVGVDIKDERVAISGWTELSKKPAFDFIGELENIGVKTVICTDISKDGASEGTNIALYKELSKRTNMDIIASGGITRLSEIKELCQIGLFGAIIGKALYTGDIDLKAALVSAKEAEL